MNYFSGVLCLAVLLNSCSPPEEDRAEFDRYLETRSAETGFSGAVLIAKNGEEILRDAYGMADRELDIPLDAEFIFRIGSLTKPLTASAVLWLVDQDKMALDDSIGQYIEDSPPAWSAVTLHHLLSHTSGIPDLFGRLDEVPVQETRVEIDRVLNESQSTALRADPGTAYAYSNFNYMLLGYAIEAATGQLWEEVLIEAFFDPLSMYATRYDDVWAIVPHRARGYTLREGQIAHIEYNDHAAYAAGGLRSTVDDLYRWHTAYVNDRLITPGLRQQATTPILGNYGYGWQVLSLFGRTMYNHSGGIDGFSSHLAYYPGEDLLIIVLSNVDTEDAKATACDLAALAFKALPLSYGTLEWLQRPRDERCRQEL